MGQMSNYKESVKQHRLTSGEMTVVYSNVGVFEVGVRIERLLHSCGEAFLVIP